MFSQTVEYALRAMVALADRHGPQSIAQISEVTHVPHHYMAKVLQSLRRADLVQSIRGIHGGFVLARTPEDLTIWDVVQSVEPIKRIRTCPLKLHAHSQVLCPLHKRMDEAIATLEGAFKSCTLADLIEDPSPSKPLCSMPKLTTIGTLDRRKKH
jgi:Rrf2 family protein